MYRIQYNDDDSINKLREYRKRKKVMHEHLLINKYDSKNCIES